MGFVLAVFNDCQVTVRKVIRKAISISAIEILTEKPTIVITDVALFLVILRIKDFNFIILLIYFSYK